MDQWPLAEEESQDTGKEPGGHLLMPSPWRSPHKSLQQTPDGLFLPVPPIWFNEEIPPFWMLCLLMWQEKKVQ